MWGRNMVTVYAELSDQKQACNAESEQENSNLIMPFLVQNEKVIKGLTTLKNPQTTLLLVKYGSCLKCITSY